ncbi:TonB-dependent receptor [Polaribacter porphyrae]|uniref:TonB-dependent receptor n=1 Tax=Polaribacter porphyrae TaxID=1137780 RepID=A0A2S7WRB2_9FLAO|nr:TonB-dependent receptor [Polaribacter porphyrae]PQJ80130.1 TonB-dependent receptor [Polaribacter porphyrae]
MKKILFILFLALGQISIAQNNATVKGILTDKEAGNEPLPFANVIIKGTTIGSTTDFDGKYSLKVPAGSHVIVFSFLGYKSIEKPFAIKAGETITINQLMSAEEGVALDQVVVKTTTSREKESALLLQQKKAVTIDQKIGQQELIKKGVSDAATALTKTTGISKQQGSGSVFVRGLGDRYNTTTLNGLPLPSNNPTNKNIDLGIFSTDIIEFISIDKTFNTKNYGDFSGANIDISSKKYKGQGFLEIGFGSAVNSEAISQNTFYLNDGPNYTGFYDVGIPNFPLNNYNFGTSWDREEANTPINLSLSIKGGDSYELGEDTKLSFFGVASFNNDYNFREGVNRGSVNTGAVARRDYDYTSYIYQTNFTAMGNILLKHKSNEFRYNALMINTTNQTQEEYFGSVDIFDYAPNGGAFVQRALFERTSLFVHQLLGDHKINENIEVNWGGAYNFVANDIPNRRQVILTPDDWNVPNGPKSFKETLNQSDNHRFFQDLEEEELAANASVSYKFDKNEDEDYLGKVTLGYNGRFKNVDFNATQFNFAIRNRGSSAVPQPLINDIYNLDSYFNQANFNAGLFDIRTFRGGLGTSIDVLRPQSYGGDQTIHAGFVNGEYKFSEKFTAVVGIRFEQINQSLSFDTSLQQGSSELDQLEILPSISLKYELDEKNNLKFAASKTYTLPQFKERAPFQYDETPTLTTLGNPALYTSTNYNLDFKWDFFPKSDEIISVGLFGRFINDPINKITINSASNDVSWVNSGDLATAYGIELEARKNIIESEVETEENTLKTKLSVGLNISYLQTNQDLDANKVFTETTAAGFPLSVDFSFAESSLTGASDLLLNADISFLKEFKKDKSIQSTVAFNYFSDRIFALATELGRGDIVDSGIPTLDFIFKYNANKNIGLGLKVNNILNPTVKRTQEVQDVLVTSFNLGVDFNLSLSYNF